MFSAGCLRAKAWNLMKTVMSSLKNSCGTANKFLKDRQKGLTLFPFCDRISLFDIGASPSRLRHRTLTPASRWFKSSRPSQKTTSFILKLVVFFLPLPFSLFYITLKIAKSSDKTLPIGRRKIACDDLILIYHKIQKDL